MDPELWVRVQVDDIKLHLRSMSFDLREKTGDSFELFKKCRLLTTSCLSRKVTTEAKNKFGAPRPHSRQRLQSFCDEQELGIDSGIGPFCKLAAAGG